MAAVVVFFIRLDLLGRVRAGGIDPESLADRYTRLEAAGFSFRRLVPIVPALRDSSRRCSRGSDVTGDRQPSTPAKFVHGRLCGLAFCC
jgi:hypothetical protein